MNLVTIIAGGLVTWRISHMLVKETGPLAIFAKFRAYLAAKQKRMGGLYDMLSCVSCTSMYVGSLAALWPAQGVFSFIWYTLAFSAVAVLIERLHAKL